MEKERLKRDLDDNEGSLRELKQTLDKLDLNCKEKVIWTVYNTSIVMFPFVRFFIFLKLFDLRIKTRFLIQGVPINMGIQ